MMRMNLRHLFQVFPKGVLHGLAIKANPLVEVLRQAVECGAGLEAASWEEVQIARAAGCEPSSIVFNSAVKTSEELEGALAMGVLINANSLDELHRISDIIQERFPVSRIGLRINPRVGAGTIKTTSVATDRSWFGVPLEQADRIVAAFRHYPWLAGLHVHVGSQSCSLEQMTGGVVQIQRLRERIENELGAGRLCFMDIGGGLPACYREGNTPPTPGEYLQLLHERVPELFGAGVRLITEFGRWVQAGSGWAVSRIEWVQPVPHPTVGVHLGADFLLRPAYQPEAWSHEFLVLDPTGTIKSGQMSSWTIAGPLCFGGDIIARNALLPSPQPGDFLVIRDTGAYALGLWSRHCSRGIPLVLGVDSGVVSVLREAETGEDVARFWSRASWK
ncbi:MAG: diaminopimelate decarboxylase, partial [Syntrophobacteraceae bacterium]|jgi:diaminopimelate decarboxylase